MNGLKCERCKSEWLSPQNRQSIFCPFCRAPLIKVEEKFDDLSTALSYMVLEFGIDILRNKQNTLQFLEEFFQEGKQEYNFLDNLYSLGLMDTLFRLQNSPSAIQKSAVKQVEKQLCEKYGASKDWAEYIVGCVCKALGIASDADESSIINLKRSAERGNPVAQVALAKRFQTGQGVDRDSEKYVYWLGEAAERDYAEAQFLLGKELYNGHICEKNVSSALLYLEHAVKNSSIDAMCFILSNIEIQALKTFDLKKIENYLLERKEELSSNQLVQLSKYFEKYDLTQTLELTKLSYAKDAKNTWQYYVALLNRVGSHESTRYDYFCVSDRWMLLDHEYSSFPVCKTDEYSYFSKRNRYFISKKELRDYLSTELKKGSPILYFKINVSKDSIVAIQDKVQKQVSRTISLGMHSIYYLEMAPNAKQMCFFFRIKQ